MSFPLSILVYLLILLLFGFCLDRLTSELESESKICFLYIILGGSYRLQSLEISYS